jgi:ribosomal protein S18 acetylase RimI-like enzyme
MNISFEPAIPDDAEILLNIQICAFHSDAETYPGVEMGGPPGYDSLEAVRNDIAKYHYHKIVGDGEIVGGIVVWNRGDGYFHLDKLYIAPEYHNRGIGSKAMQFIEQNYPANRWTLDTPLYATRNQHFYEKFGYVKVGESDEDGLILIAYEKRV